MKHHNVCECHIATDTGVKQTEHTIFSTLLQCDKRLQFSDAFLKKLQQMSVNFGNRISQNSHKNQYPGPVCKFGFTEPQYSDRC